MRALDDEDDLEDSEWPDEGPDDDAAEDESVGCRYCRRPVSEDAERCPSCGHYLSREDAPKRYPWWFVVGFLLTMTVLLGWIVLGA